MLFFSYLNQAYVSLLGIALMPAYLHYLGPEGTGLIGLFLMIQALLPLLDFGLTPVLSREVSRYRAGTLDALAVRLRLHGIEGVFLAGAAVCFVIVFAFRRALAGDWLNFSALASGEVESCLVLMSAAAVLRWTSGIYRATLIGLERQSWLNGAAAILASFRFVGVLPVLAWYSSAATTFFCFQLLAAGVELVVFCVAAYRGLPRGVPGMPVRQPREGIGKAVSMAGSMGFLAVIWILLNQLDKLILSRTLTLEEYGYFTLAASAAAVLQVLMAPLNQVVQPRLTIMAETRRLDDLADAYALLTQFATALFVAAGAALALFSDQLLWSWVADDKAVRLAGPVLFWYSLAGTLIGVLLPPFMLQFAFGYLRLHVIGNAVLLLTLLPVVAWVAIEHGAVGVGIVLVAWRLLFLLFWVPIVHRRLMPSMVTTWPVRHVARVAAAATAVVALAAALLPRIDNRFAGLVLVAAVCATAFVVGTLAGDRSRQVVLVALGARK